MESESTLPWRSYDMKKTKTFDCVEMKRTGAEKVREKTKGMTMEEEAVFWKQRSSSLKDRKAKI